jgi:hypothetical protein
MRLHRIPEAQGLQKGQDTPKKFGSFASSKVKFLAGRVAQLTSHHLPLSFGFPVVSA